MRASKKLPLFASALALLAASPLSATLLMEETFDYAAGSSISGQNGGSGFGDRAWTFGNSATGSITVTESGAALTGPSSTWARRAVAIDANDTPVFYFSYTITATGSGALEGNSIRDMLIFRDGVSSPYTELFWTGLYYDKDGIRVRANSAGSTNFSMLGTGKTAVNTVYTIVGRFTFDDGTGKAALDVWVNPEDESATPSYSSSWSSSITSVTQIQIERADGGTRGVGVTTVFDNIRIATDWDSAVNGSPVPEPSSAAVLAGVAGLAFASSRRRRR